MVGWHHRLNGHEFQWTPGVGDGQGGLVCCSPWGCKELDMTEWLNWTELIFCWMKDKRENHLLMYFWLFCLFSLFVKSNWLRKYFLSTTIENSFLQANPVNFVFSVYFWSMSEFGQNVTIRILYMSLSQKNLHSFVCVWNIFPLLYILLNVVIITKKQAIF